MDRRDFLPFGCIGTDIRLSAPEERLVVAAREGRRWEPLANLDGIDLPKRALAFPWLSETGIYTGPLAACSVRAEILYCLLTGAKWAEGMSPWPLHGSGLVLSHAVVHGDLNLEGCEVLAPLHIRNSAIVGHVKLRDAHTRSLGFDGTHLHSISAQRAQVEGSLCVSRGFFALGGLDLRDAYIRNRLDARGGRFECWSAFMLAAERLFGCSLAAQALQVGNDVMLGDGFHAAGSINLMQADIGGSLNCAGGVFSPESGKALCARAAVIGGEVLLNDKKFDWQQPIAFGAREVIERHPCHFNGQVDLSEARIGLDLRCDGGWFHNPGAIALEARGIAVGGDVWLTDNCRIDGQADFTAAHIGRSLRCKGGYFLAPGDEALRLKAAHIDAGLHLSAIAGFAGALNLRRASANFVDVDETILTASPAPIANETQAINAMMLDDFIYSRLADAGLPVSSLVAWLDAITDEAQNVCFKAQPWGQLAQALRDMGAFDKADAILEAMSKRCSIAA